MKEIITKFITNTISNEELVQLREWLHKDKNQKTFENYVIDYYDVHLLMTKPDISKAYKDVWTKIQEEEKPVKRLVPYWFRYVAAASIVIMVTLSYVVFHNKSEITPTELRNSTIKVGTDKATLTLEDGSDIVLEKGNTYEAANVNSNGEELIYNTKNTTTTTKREIAYNYLTIPRGGQFHVRLSDGTEVWLNSESRLKYPKVFIEGETRKVELIYGEAYFDVSSSTNHQGTTFKVFNKTQEVEVLGTEFNIKAYKDEIIVYTTLVEGKVSVDNKTAAKILTPNQQSKVSSENQNIEITTVDVYDETSWKDGVFAFKDKPLKDIMKVLSRWYNTDIVINNKTLENIKFNGVLSKKQRIEDILSSIKITNNINYKINEKEISIN